MPASWEMQDNTAAMLAALARVPGVPLRERVMISGYRLAANMLGDFARARWQSAVGRFREYMRQQRTDAVMQSPNRRPRIEDGGSIEDTPPRQRQRFQEPDPGTVDFPMAAAGVIMALEGRKVSPRRRGPPHRFGVWRRGRRRTPQRRVYGVSKWRRYHKYK